MTLLVFELEEHSLQDGHAITFISQALTSTQQCYSNIECELLAVVVVVEYLHHYIFGRKFTVHRPFTISQYLQEVS